MISTNQMYVVNTGNPNLGKDGWLLLSDAAMGIPQVHDQQSVWVEVGLPPGHTTGDIPSWDDATHTWGIAQIPQPRGRVGAIESSVLTEAQFNTMVGPLEAANWMLADGRACVGTDFERITGQNTVPNLTGAFLRGNGAGTAALGTHVPASTAMPTRPFTAAAAAGGGHAHTATEADGGAHGHTGAASTNAGDHQHRMWDAHSGWGAGMDDPQKRVTGSNYGSGASNNPVYHPNTSHAGDHNHAINLNPAAAHKHAITVAAAPTHTHGITLTGGDSETAPVHVVVSYFIRVNA
jgi:hypothetical protein